MTVTKTHQLASSSRELPYFLVLCSIFTRTLAATLVPQPAGIHNLEPQMSAVQQREASLRQKVVTSRLQHRAVSPGAKAEIDPTAARLVERMSSFRVMGILFVLRDFLAILDELNTLFQFRLPTYSGVGTDLDRAKRKPRLWFFGG